MVTRALAVAVAALVTAGTARAEDDLEAFPKAEPGMVRYVLRLPKEADESALRVELIAGKTVQVDDRNRYTFGGRIKPVVIEGWGFTRYVVSALGPMAGTLMATDPAAPKVERFVAIGGEPYLVRYNSRLPIVVYAPEGVEVRYRRWTAGPGPRPLEKG